ncbi:ERV1/ALR-related protein [Aureliella helgolandensis]|uniref:thiol oxidase n=1 Tax=Aureliella helgolandensis TaxID=2527968 RepID=A0A518G730_9BACT|nr:ERV1/ALR-related protein [Aureliella helgolandensis]QDV24394.1 Erv1 / Alr family protein [Aureliella helgolandensis]
MIKCDGCGRLVRSSVLPLHCHCGTTTHKLADGTANTASSSYWGKLHRYTGRDAAWVWKWLDEYNGCPACKADFRRYMQRNPPNTKTKDSLFMWGVDAHNWVNQKLGRAIFTYTEARRLYRSTPNAAPDLPTYDQDTAAALNANVDVVIPFHGGDARFAAESIESMLEQRRVFTFLHIIADQCDIPAEVVRIAKTDPEVRLYTTPRRMGPYRIANSIARHEAASDFLAIQDADDISTPHRLAKQLQTLIGSDYAQTSGAMQNFTDEQNPYLLDRRQTEHTILPGVCFHHVPGGRCVNSVRTIKRAIFELLNGFADELCSMDFDLDNRLALAGFKTHWASDVVGMRRLHSQSLTNGPEYGPNTAARRAANALCIRNLKTMQKRPTINQAAELGGMLKAERLQRIN